MSKIIGNTTTTPVPRSDWEQIDKTKADFIRHKPVLGTIAEKDASDYYTKSEIDTINNKTQNQRLIVNVTSISEEIIEEIGGYACSLDQTFEQITEAYLSHKNVYIDFTGTLVPLVQFAEEDAIGFAVTAMGTAIAILVYPDNSAFCVMSNYLLESNVDLEFDEHSSNPIANSTVTQLYNAVTDLLARAAVIHEEYIKEETDADGGTIVGVTLNSAKYGCQSYAISHSEFVRMWGDTTLKQWSDDVDTEITTLKNQPKTFVQDTAPSSAAIGDIWIDTSVEGAISIEGVEF